MSRFCIFALSAVSDNASWAQMSYSKVIADLADQNAGNSSGPSCSSGQLDSVIDFSNLEGSSKADGLLGGGGDNYILGRDGADGVYGRNGNDSIDIKDIPASADSSVSCGAGQDSLSRDSADPNNIDCQP